MATAKKGKDLTGLIGNLIFYEVDGQMRVRTRSSKNWDPESEKLERAQSKFTFIMKLMQHFKIFIVMGFEASATTRSPFHEAMSVNLQNYNDALREGRAEGLYWIELSRGPISGAATIEAERLTSTTIQVKWEGTQPDLSFSIDDSLVLLVCRDSGDTIYYNDISCKRSAGNYTFNLTSKIPSDDLHLFMCFKSRRVAKEKAIVSNSQYLKF